MRKEDKECVQIRVSEGKTKTKKRTHQTDGCSGRGLDMARCAACRGRGRERVVVAGASVVVETQCRG